MAIVTVIGIVTGRIVCPVKASMPSRAEQNRLLVRWLNAVCQECCNIIGTVHGPGALLGSATPSFAGSPCLPAPISFEDAAVQATSQDSCSKRIRENHGAIARSRSRQARKLKQTIPTQNCETASVDNHDCQEVLLCEALVVVYRKQGSVVQSTCVLVVCCCHLQVSGPGVAAPSQSLHLYGPHADGVFVQM